MVAGAGQMYDSGSQSGRPPAGQHRLEVSLLGHVRQQARAVLAERGLEPALQHCVVVVALLLVWADRTVVTDSLGGYETVTFCMGTSYNKGYYIRIKNVKQNFVNVMSTLQLDD